MKRGGLSKYKAGDTISISTNQGPLVSGTVYINGSIPMSKFYEKLYGTRLMSFDGNDNYEDAIVLIDNNEPGVLTVLTLDEGDMKLFRWNDVFEKRTERLEHKKIKDGESLYVNYDSAILMEIKHSFV